MHARPVAVLVCGQQGSVSAQARETLCSAVRPCDRTAQLRLQVVHDRDLRQEIDVRRIQVGEQQADELLAQRTAARRHGCERGADIGAGGDDRQCELQAEWPAFGQFVQARSHVLVDARTEAAAYEGQGFVEFESEC
jgi:hypothetical protein